MSIARHPDKEGRHGDDGAAWPHQYAEKLGADTAPRIKHSGAGSQNQCRVSGRKLGSAHGAGAA